MDFQYILMRHAYAQHNKVKQQTKKRYGNYKKFKDIPNSSSLRMQKELIDCSITKQGKKQAKQIAQSFDPSQIGIIIISPLKRCLQTCHQFLENMSNKPQVIVDPLLADRVSSSWAIHSRFQDSQKLFPQFKFQERQHYANVYINFDKKYWGKQSQSKLGTLHMIKEGFSESYLEFHARVQQFRSKLKKYKQKAIGKRIMIITHSSFMKFLTGTGVYNKQRKQLTGHKFQHCIPLYFHNQTIEKGNRILFMENLECQKQQKKKHQKLDVTGANMLLDAKM